MRYGKIWISLLTAALAAAAVLLWQQEPEPEPFAAAEDTLPISVQVSARGRTEDISCWEGETGQYYVFLPSFADLSETALRTEAGAEVRIGGQALENGQSCGSFRISEPYALEYSKQGEAREGTITFLCSAQVPSMHIDVQSGNMDYIHALKGNKESGRIRIYNADGTVSFAGNLKSISGRGNATWTMEKKPYSLVLAGEADLLGLGQAQRWVLLANGSDPSHLRNKFVYDYAADAGLDYSPGSQWVDLYLNGEYAGLYLLSERNEIHPQRVALAENSSFLVSMELGWRLEDQGYPFISTDAGFDLRIHHSSVTDAELLELWQSAENAILAEDGIDPVTGKDWTELIDLDSWARKYLMEEIFGSVDAGAVSQYFYGDPESGKICAGPVWDYDISMGNTGAWQLSQPEAFFADRARLNAWADDPWFYALCRKEAFRERVVELYRDVFQPLLEAYLTENLDACAAQVKGAALMNQYRWQVYSPQEETEYIRSYMTRRMDFLTGVWLEGEQYYTVLVDTNDGSNTACYAVRAGDPLPQLRDITYIPDAIGWYYRDTEEIVDTTQPVTGDLDIYLKYQVWDEDWEASDSLYSRLSRVPLMVLLAILLAAMGWDLLRLRRTYRKKREEKPKVPRN